MKDFLFTSESVTEGHPDKICDQISDAILDAIIQQDPQARVAVESMVTTGLVHIAGEVRTQGYVEIPELIRKLITGIGYTSSQVGFDGESCGVSVSIGAQSAEIASGVDSALEHRDGDLDELSKLGAGDQGIMFGYANRETPELMPLAITLSHRITEKLASVRKTGELEFLRPDGKAQVTIRYVNGEPTGVDTVVVSTQHAPDVSQARLAEAVIEVVVKPVLESYQMFNKDIRYLINPSGSFIVGGPQGDAGLTGRKIIVDTYGGAARHGGGAFSGKDPSKVDRSAAYAMRWVAKNIVASGVAEKAEVQVAYAIGKAHPVSLMIDTFGTATVSDEKLEKAVLATFDLRPGAIIRDLDLLRPIYLATASYGHFGRELPDFSWERTDRAESLKDLLGS